ncbi:hypothetical protein ES288_A05G428800v1 [Gossypium darwinii]|uniref:Uncharacterized protein n=1 Tax=Gossypium darwinii TaxID=34276 RepID=A0A5D2GT82_GOSDA|nr:hypothetical protein ES288_A05G428800v1 [Gossypium darwinii]
MKGGDGFRTTGKKISVALLALVLMTLLLWDWETNPFVYTHVSTQYQSNTPPASMDITYEVCIHCDPNNSTEPMEPAETKTDGNKYQSLEKEEGKEPMENGDDFEAEMIDGSFVNGTASVDTKGTRECNAMHILPCITNEGCRGLNCIISIFAVCNYARGRWVADSRPPLYAAQCKYMERKWACRLSSRTDFSYEGYRWQSVDCQKPEFEASHFLERMKDKIVAFVGDTLSRQQFESMMCMLTGGQESSDIEDVQFLYTGEIHHPGWGYRFRTFIRENIDHLNVLVMNTDQHWRKTLVSWDNEVMYVNGAPVQDRNLKNISNAMIFKVNNIVKWLDSKLASNPNLQVFFRTKSPTHFFKGDWDTGGRCDNTIPMTRGSEVFEDESSDKVVAAAVKGTRVKLLDITALSDLRDEAHNSYYGKNSPDCLHWCLPSVPDTWNELLNAQL